MKKSSINDVWSFKSVNIDHLQQQVIPFDANSLLIEIKKYSYKNPQQLAGIVARLSIEFPNFTEDYEQLIIHISQLEEAHFKVALILDLTLLQTSNDNWLIANLLNLINGYEELLIRDNDLTNFVLDVVLCLCLDKKTISLKDIVIAAYGGLPKKLQELLIGLSDSDIQFNNIVKAIVLSKLYSKLCEICSLNNLYKLLLLTSVIARVEILNDDMVESLLGGLVDILELMDRRLADEELAILLKIMTKNKWRDEWVAEESTDRNRRVYIEFRLQKIVNAVTKKLIRERQLKNRNHILKIVLSYFNPTMLQINDELLETFMYGLRRQTDPEIETRLYAIVSEAIKGEVTLKMVKSIIKNMKISASHRNSSEIDKILKNFELLEIISKYNGDSHQALELFSKSSAIYFENISVKAPFTIIMEVKLKPRLHELSYLITLVNKKSSLTLMIKKKAHRKDFYELKVNNSANPQRHRQNYDFEASCERIYLSLSTHKEGLLATANNFCFLIPQFSGQIKQIIVGNIINSGKLTNQCAVQELQLFCVVNEFVETSQLFCKFRLRELNNARFKQSPENLNVLINLNNKGEWESKMSGVGVFSKLFQATEEVAQQIECYKIIKPSLMKMLHSSGNIGVFLLLIEYYSIKVKESEFLVLTDSILQFLLVMLRENDEKSEIREWLTRSIHKFGLAIWIISYSIKENSNLISKIMNIISVADGFQMPTGEDFNFECMRGILLNFQIWRNFSYEDQMVVCSILSKQLNVDQSSCAETCLQKNELKRLLIAILVYYNKDISLDFGIKRKLSKEQLLRLQMQCREIFIKCMSNTFKPIIESRNRHKINWWIESFRCVFYLAIVTCEPFVNKESNPYYSKQSLFEMLRVVRRLINNLAQKQTHRLFQEMLNKEELFKQIDGILLIILEHQIATADLKLKKYVIDMLEDTLLDVLLIKQYSIETIIGMFERLRRQEHDASEVTFIFKLFIKLHKLGLPGDQQLYKSIERRSMENFNNPTYYVTLKDQIEEFLKLVDHRHFIDVLNNMTHLIENIMKYEGDTKNVEMLILRKYLQCERMESIPQCYYLYINLLEQFPQISQKIQPLSMYRLASTMMREKYICFLQQNFKSIQAFDTEPILRGILGFVLVKMPNLSDKQLKIMLNIYERMNTEPLNPIIHKTQNVFLDLILLTMFRRLSKLLQNHEQHTEVLSIELQSIIEIAHLVFKESVINRLYKEIVFEDYSQSSAPKVGLGLQLENIHKLFSMNVDVADVTLQRLELYREVIEKIVTTIENYAEKPVSIAINQLSDQLIIPKYQFKSNANSYTKNNLSTISILRTKSLNIDRARQTYEDLKILSFDMLSNYFDAYEAKCMETERSWRNDKRLNYYWQYFTYSKESNFFSVDSSLDSLNSRINIKVSSNAFSQQFPRRKSGGAQFRRSFDNSSISISESEGDGMMQSMVFENRSNKKSGQRKESSDIIAPEKEQLGIFYCEYIKPKGVFFGRFKVTDKTATFHSNPNEEQFIHKDTYMELSTSDYLKQRKQKNKEFDLTTCEVFTRRYILRHTAIQIFYRGKSYFFNFFKVDARSELLNKLKKKVSACIINRKAEFQKELYTEKWKLGKISNFEYLMKINLYSGRSYNDLSQYPVYPWVIKNFTDDRVNKEFINNCQNYRDLTKPMGEQNQVRFQEFLSRMNDVESNVDTTNKFLYGSFYSNPTIITHYLIRLEPFSTLHWKHQSKRFDHADRLFSSIQDQYNSCMKNTSDLKELIPQFYSWPQFLRNRNQIYFGLKQNKTEVNDVQCPKWASCPEQVIFRFRQALESQYVSKHINEWIDLIFGYKSKQRNALTHNNLFHQRTYEHDIFQRSEEEEEDDIKLAQTYVSEFGQVPECLFETEHIARESSDIQCLDAMCVVDECKQCTQIVLSNYDCVMVVSKKVMNLLLVNILHVDSKLVKKHIVHLESDQRKFQFFKGPNVRWIEFGKSEMSVHSLANIKNKNILVEGQNMFESVLVDINSIVTAEQSRLLFMSIKDGNVKLQQVSHCHQDRIYIVEYCQTSDIVVSVDHDNIVGLHYARHKSKIREFNIKLKHSQHITKIRIHPLGFIFFWTNSNRLKAYSFIGDVLFGIYFKLPSLHEEITQFRIFTVDKSIILLSSTKGFIYSIDIFDIYRFSKTNPREAFPIEGAGLLSNLFNAQDPSKKLTRKDSATAIMEPIMDFDVDWSHKPFWKLVVLYQKGKLCYYMSKKQKEQRIHQQISELRFS